MSDFEREGQAYFVHNRVESIYEIASKIQELVPQARVIVGHGQMSEGQLEKAMMAFVLLLLASVLYDGALTTPEWGRLESALDQLIRAVRGNAPIVSPA